MNVVTKSGTNAFHGSAFVFHNDKSLNSRSNLDKARRPHGGAVPGREPVSVAPSAARSCRDKTFFFGSYQRWTDRRARLGLHAQRRADRGGPPGAAIGRGNAAAGAGAAEALAGSASRDGTHVHLHPRRSNLQRAAGLADRIVGRRASTTTRPVHAGRSPAQPEPHARRPVPLGHTPEDPATAGHATGPDRRASPNNQHSIGVWLNSVLAPARRTNCAWRFQHLERSRSRQTRRHRKSRPSRSPSWA